MRLTQTILSDVAARYQAGESTTALGTAYGVNKATIVRWLHKAGIPLITGPELLRGQFKPGLRVCTMCRQALPDSAFSKNSSLPRGIGHLCKACMRADAHNRMLRRTYGITLGEYEAMLAAQGGGCAICGTTEPPLSRWGTRVHFHVDHDHLTGRVRGLLCAHCNIGLEQFQDSPALLRQAATYLEIPIP